MKRFSASQLQTFMSCKCKWYYNYIKNLIPRVDRPYLTIGKLCHKGMQVAMTEIWKNEGWNVAILQGAKAIQDEWQNYMDNNVFLEEEIPELEQLRSDAVNVFVQAFQEFEPWKYEVVSVCGEPALEYYFEVPLDGVILHGFIDAILRDKETGHVWCVDYKFRKSLAPDEDEAFNIQNAIYSYACRALGVDITGTLTWQHLNTPASEPKLNKDGTVSRAKIKTTWNTYRDFCVANGIDWTEYEEEMREKLSDIEFFRCTYEYRNAPTVQNILEQCVLPTIRSIITASEYPKSLYPWNCKMCQYQELCQAELRNYDIPPIIDMNFKVREQVEEVTNEAEV